MRNVFSIPHKNQLSSFHNNNNIENDISQPFSSQRGLFLDFKKIRKSRIWRIGEDFEIEMLNNRNIINRFSKAP
jgi:hypothetical protein